MKYMSPLSVDGLGIGLSKGLAGIAIAFLPVLFPLNGVLAQITPDNTLGVERSIVTPNVNLRGTLAARIEGGATRDRHLFHSFSEFNIGDLQQVYFANPSGIETIFSRVTGTDVSDILGTLGVDGDADVFFLNPNGIIFGENARLDIAGSFVATTADAFQFGNQGVFSARNPEAPPALLTIDPSAFVFGSQLAGAITVQAIGDDGGLQVPNGENLQVLGGDVVVDRGQLTALGGLVEIASVGGEGNVALSTNGHFAIPDTMQRGSIVLSNGAEVDVASDNGGDMHLTAQTIDVENGSFLQAGIGEGLGHKGSQAGDITLDASDRITFDGEFPSEAFSDVAMGGVGDGGNIEITTPILELLNGSQLSSKTFGEGNAGNVIIQASDRITFDGTSTDGQYPSAAFSSVEMGGVGDGGNIEITTPTLEILNGAQLITDTSGEGNAGSVIIQASDRVTFDGTSTDGQYPSAAFSSVEMDGVGDGGNIEITTPILEILNGAQLSSRTFGEGNAGGVIIQASDRVTVDFGDIFSDVEMSGIGDGGNIEITTPTLEILNRAQLITDTSGAGNAGNVIIQASDRVTFDFGDIFSSVEMGGVGDGGNIEITTPILEILNGAQLITETSGDGNAGNVIMQASDRVTFDGMSADGQFPSGAFSSVEMGGVGDGGNIEITTSILEILNEALLITDTAGAGNAGNVIIQASDRVTVDGGGIFSDVAMGGVGDGGNIEITTPLLDVLNGTLLSSSTLGEGNAGSMIIQASDRVTFDGMGADFPNGAFSSVEIGGVGDGGNIEIKTPILEMFNGAQLLTSIFGEGNAGDVIIQASERVTLDGTSADGQFPSVAFSGVAPDGRGNAGNIEITTPVLELFNEAELVSSTFGEGNAGNLIITVPRIILDNGLIRTESTFVDSVSGSANIELRALDLLVMQNDSLISAAAFNQAIGGNLTINTANTSGGFIVAPPLNNSDIIATAEQGRGGEINIFVDQLLGFTVQDSPIDLQENRTNDISASSAAGPQGVVNLNTLDVDPSQGLNELPVALVETSPVDIGCNTQRQGSSAFVITGRGGLMPAPGDLVGQSLWDDMRAPSPSSASSSSSVSSSSSLSSIPHQPLPPRRPVEAQTWSQTPNGQLRLLAQTPVPLQSNDTQCQTVPTCNVSR